MALSYLKKKTDPQTMITNTHGDLVSRTCLFSRRWQVPGKQSGRNVILSISDKSTKQSKEAKERGGRGHQPQKQSNELRQYKYRYTIKLHMQISTSEHLPSQAQTLTEYN